ncbi:unnamed protein product [Rotaria magnacalcarata]|uniref:K Homology domain-containing protein n=1 Tax=Rotaria magnacalcarata TaxID=392030 RepID=A0A816CR91_9BILA|nr:unnamed protein product [Rotaria magnacalcarata]
MATANHFQTRVLIPDKTSLTNNEIRINLLLEQAQTYFHTLNDLQATQYRQNLTQASELDLWSSKMFEKIDDLYKSCLNDLKQSFQQLKSFQQLMIKILYNENENNLDGNKLLTIEQEICILKCLSYLLDTTKVKIEGKFKSNKNFNSDESEVLIDEHDTQNNMNEKSNKKDFICRILVHKDAINKIENLSLIQQFVEMKTDINKTTPERILTINGPHRLDVIEQILSTVYSASLNQCELRILLHQSYAPLILGKLGDRSKLLREKYSLHNLTIHPTCAPHSTERVLLIQSLSPEKILSCLQEIFININQHTYDGDEIILYDEINYDASLVHEYGGFPSSESITRSNEQHNQYYDQTEKFDEEEEENESIRRYSAFDAWNGSVEADTDHEFSIVKIGETSIIREFWINHGQFGALLGPHGVRIAQIRSQCRTVRIHTVAGSSIDTCSVKVIGPRVDVNHAVNLIMQSIKEHDRKFPFKHHRFSGRLR